MECLSAITGIPTDEHGTVGSGRLPYGYASESRSDNAWEAHSDSVPSNWRILFKKDGAREWKTGDEAEFRVYQLVPAKKELRLTDSERGFAPIFDKMRTRYRVAIRNMLELCATEKPEIPDQTTLLDAIADIKGAINAAPPSVHSAGFARPAVPQIIVEAIHCALPPSTACPGGLVGGERAKLCRPQLWVRPDKPKEKPAWRGRHQVPVLA